MQNRKQSIEIANNFYQTALRLQQTGHFDESIALFDSSIVYNPQVADVFFAQGSSYESVAEHAKALYAYNRAISLQPAFEGAKFRKAVCLYNLRLYEDAINELDLLIANNGSGSETRAIFYSYSPAEGLSISTDNQLKAEYFLYRGLTYAAIGQAEKAMADMDSAVTLSGQSTDYLVNRGLVYQRLGMKSKATLDYELALERNPDNQTALVNLFTLDAAKAKSYLNENAEIISDIIVPELLAQLAYDACNEGQFEEGLNYYSKALSMLPSEADWVMNRAICYGKAGLLEQSKEELLRVITMKDFSTKAFLHLANVLFLQEQYEQAISFYNQFIATEPAYGTAYFNRGIAYNKIGKDDLACRDLQIAAQLGVSESAKPLQAICNR